VLRPIIVRIKLKYDGTYKVLDSPFTHTQEREREREVMQTDVQLFTPSHFCSVLLCLCTLVISFRTVMHFVSLKTTTITIIVTLPQISEILSRFERKGYKLVAIKLIVPSKEFAGKHYHDLKERPFFNGLCDFLNS
jgi:hypothetical protein